ncbi:CARDB domain-containing protein [Actinospongicola halichondriae]|uniref:CARDB domain-containing protein n=1 Tax=Actinospongicola halichondriae TaxID=3236844 RepID=UPI003D4D576D
MSQRRNRARSVWTGHLWVLALLSTALAVVPAATPVAAQEAPGRHLDQQLANDAYPADGERQTCSTTEYPGRRSLLGGTPESQTFRASRSDLVEIDVCLTANFTSSFSVAIYASDDNGVPEGDAIGRGEGTATRDAGSESRFETVSFGTDLGLTPGERYVLQLEGPGGSGRPSVLVMQWRATCTAQPIFGGCAADSPVDQYPDGNAIGYPARTDFAFRTWTSTTADLEGSLLDAPRHLCRTRPFDAAIRVTNDGTASVRASTAHVDVIGGSSTADATGPVEIPPLGPGASTRIPISLLLDADDLGDHDGRVVLRLTVDDTDVVVETDESDNTADTAAKLTGCDEASISAIDLAAASPVGTTGVDQVPIHDLPFATMSFGTTGIEANGFQHNGFQHNGFQHNGFQHNPLLGGTLSENGFQHNPADPNQRHTGAANTTSFLYGAPLSVLDDIDLTSVDLIREGGWTAVFRTHGDVVRAQGGSTPLDHVPLNDLSLLDAMTLDPAPVPAITFAELDIADSGLAALTWASVATGATPLDGLPIGMPWCDLLAANGIDCATNDIDTSVDTLVTVNLLGLDMDRVPFGELTLDRVALHPDSPLAAAPLYTGSTLPGFDARRTSWADVAVGSDGFGGVVRCDTGLCDGTATLAEVSAANAFEPGAHFRDLVAALPTDVLAAADLGTAILGMVHTIGSLPLESADLDSVLLGSIAQDGPRTTYALTVTADDLHASLVDPTLSITLPPDFAVVAETATLDAGDELAVLGTPTIDTGVADGFRQQIVRWSTDLHVPHGDSVTLTVEAVNARTIGLHRAIGRVDGTDLVGVHTASTEPTAPVALEQAHEPDGSADPDADYPTLVEDSLFVSHIAEPGDVDVVKIPVPTQPGSEVRLVLSQMEGDYDLAVSGATVDAIASSGFQHNGFQHNGFQHNGFQHNGFQHNPAIPSESAQWEANGASNSSPQPLQDVPLDTPVLREHGLRAVSIERGAGTTESIDLVSREGESGFYFVQVSGFNGDAGPDPFVLRYHVVHPEQVHLGECQAAPFTADPADAGELPDPEAIDPSTNTLYLMAPERMDARFDGAGTQSVLDQIDAVDAADVDVNGLVVPVGADPEVAAAYAAWDADRCSPAAANRVAFEIRDLVMDYRDQVDIDHIVVIGDDDQIPFTRLRDDAAIGNERTFVSAIVAEMGIADVDGDPSNGLQPANGTPLTSALLQGLFLADTPMASSQAAEWLDAAYWLPDAAIGRLVGEPETMVEAMQQFIESDGELDPTVLDPTATAVTGYDHLADGAEAVADALDANLTPSARRLISEDHSRSDIEDLLTFDADDRDAVVSLNGHSDQSRFLPALGNSTGEQDDLLEATDLGGLPLGSLVLSMGCHFGLDLPTPANGEIVDWADAVAANQGILLADTGYNYGDTETVGAGELYMQVFAQHLDGTSSVGEAASATVTELFARDKGQSSEVFKSIQGVVTYGLPMYRIHTSDEATAPTIPESAPATTDTAATADLDVHLTVLEGTQSCPPGETCLRRVASGRGDGEYYTAEGPDSFGTVTAAGEPIGPRLSIDVSHLVPPGHRAHGATVRSRTTGVDLADFDPVFASPALRDHAGSTEPQASDTVYPLRTVEVDTDVTSGRTYLTVLPWAFRATGEDDAGRIVGNLRLDSELTIRLMTSTDDGFARPGVETWSARRQGSGVAFDVAVRPGDGEPAVGVSALYRDQFGTWRRSDLVTGDGGTTWAGVGPLPGTDDTPIEVAIDVWTASGNHAHSANKGDLVPIVNPSELSHELHSDAVGENGWFRGPVTVEFPDGPDYERRSGPDSPFEPFPGNSFTVDTDGIHRFEVRTSDGAQTATGIVVAIDTAAPEIVIESPVDGATYAHDAEIVADFVCADRGPSGLATCAGDADAGATLEPGPGTHTFSVTTTDSAGNTGSASVSFTVEEAPIDFVGFYWPVDNTAWNRVEVESDRDADDPWGRVVPFVWRLYRDGVWQSDPGLIADTEWQRVTCAVRQEDAIPDGSSPVHAASWDGGGVWTWSRYRLQGYNAAVPDSFYSSCHRFDLTLVDGTIHHAYFQFVVKAPAKRS